MYAVALEVPASKIVFNCPWAQKSESRFPKTWCRTIIALKMWTGGVSEKINKMCGGGPENLPFCPPPRIKKMEYR